MLWERLMFIAITSPNTWEEYATWLHTMPHQVPLPDLPKLCPPTCTFFTIELVKKAINKLSNRGIQDCAVLVVEHFIHDKDMVANLLALMFTIAMCEGCPKTWSMFTIVPTFNCGDPSSPFNYRTIMVGHSLVKLYAFILEHELTKWAKREGIQAFGHVGF